MTSRLLRAQAHQVLDLMHLLVRRCGGWDQVWDDITPAGRAEVILKLITSHDALIERSEERARQETTAIKNAACDRVAFRNNTPGS